MSIGAVPLWGLLLATTAVAWLSIEGGFRLGRRRQRTQPAGQEGPLGQLVGATLALLAFLLTFTFSMAASRFEARRMSVLDEANAVGTTFLRAEFLPEPERARTRQLLRDYVAARLTVVSSDQVGPAIAKAEALHGELWSQTAQLVRDHPQSIALGLFVDSLNTMIDLHGQRVQAGVRSHIPGVIWAVLLFVTVLAMGATGYQSGLIGGVRSPVHAALVLAFCGVIALIGDLDRTHEGLLRVSQQSLIDLQNTMGPLP